MVIVVTVVRRCGGGVAAVGRGRGGREEAGEEVEDEGPEGGEAGGYDAAGGFDGGPDDGAVEGPGEVRVVDFELFGQANEAGDDDAVWEGGPVRKGFLGWGGGVWRTEILLTSRLIRR